MWFLNEVTYFVAQENLNEFRRPFPVHLTQKIPYPRLYINISRLVSVSHRRFSYSRGTISLAPSCLSTVQRNRALVFYRNAPREPGYLSRLLLELFGVVPSLEISIPHASGIFEAGKKNWEKEGFGSCAIWNFFFEIAESLLESNFIRLHLRISLFYDVKKIINHRLGKWVSEEKYSVAFWLFFRTMSHSDGSVVGHYFLEYKKCPFHITRDEIWDKRSSRFSWREGKERDRRHDVLFE